MRGGRTICAVLAAVLAASVVAPAAAASPRPPIPVLKGRTTAVAETTGYTTVRLPRPIDIKDGWSITPHGRGRVRGFVLTQVGETLLDTPSYVMVFPGYCLTAGCGDAEWEGGGFGFLTGTDGSWMLPAGTYRMYVIADAAPLRIELEIGGYSGRTTIPANLPAEVDFDSFRTRPASTPDGTIYVGGGFSDLGGGNRGFAMMQMWGLRDEQQQRPYAFGDCVYHGSEADHPAPEHAFAPGCPGSGQKPYLFVGMHGPGYLLGVTAMNPIPHGIGGHSTTPLAQRAGGTAVWMPLTEALP